MAIESIKDRIFSTQSDIWSFGIVLWEFFSLAETPYPGMQANDEFFKNLVNGYRMDQPKFAPNAMYFDTIIILNLFLHFQKFQIQIDAKLLAVATQSKTII